MNLAEVLRGVAPTLATALGGPLAGMAATFLAGKLGLPEKSIDAVSAAVAGMSGPDLVKMKEMDLEFQKFMAENNIKLDLAQIAVNTADAQSDDKFQRRWRPAIGWVCAFGLAYATILLPFMEFICKVVFQYGGEFPKVDWAILGQVLLGMLGMSGLRTYEKTRNGNEK